MPETKYERLLFAENAFLREQFDQRDERIAALEKRVKELEVLLAKALKNSSTSSKPPSSDIVKPPKPPCSSPDGKRKKGGQPGHVRHERQPFTSEISQTKKYSLERCPDCGGSVKPLSEQEARLMQQVEVVPEHIRVVEHRGLACQCTCCGKKYRASLPAPVKKGGLVGPVLTAQIAYMKCALHASFSTIHNYLRDVMGLRISRGQLSKIIQKVSNALEIPYGDLSQLLRTQEVLNVDETGHKDNGDRFWTWCFRAQNFAVFKVVDTRSSQVLFDVLGREFSGVLGCDFYPAYQKYIKNSSALLQFCLAHFIREIKFLTKLPDKDAQRYGERLLEKMRALFHVIHKHDELPDKRFNKLLSQARDAILHEAQKGVPQEKHSQLVAKRLQKHGEGYFRFITTPGVEPTNNIAEQAIRFITIDRHITQGTRSEAGQQWSERIWTVMATCALQGRSPFDYLVGVVHAHFNELPIPSLLVDTS